MKFIKDTSKENPTEENKMKRLIFLLISISITVAQNYNDLSTFDMALSEMKKEKKQIKSTSTNSEIDNYTSKNNSYTQREIIITDDSLLAEINFYQDKIDILCNYKDKYFKEMQELNLSDKERYIYFLLKNHLKDTTECINLCNRVCKILNHECGKLYIIAQAQKGNTKAFINRHIKNKRAEMRIINNIRLNLAGVKNVYK